MTVPRETPQSLEDLHGGWPFGPGPDQWPWRIELRNGTEIQPSGTHAVCCVCGQSITRIGRWAMSWVALKPQVAAHVMQVHSEHVTG